MERIHRTPGDLLRLSAATSATVLPCLPTCQVAHRPARAVIVNRDELIFGATQFMTTLTCGSGQRQCRLSHANRVGWPTEGRHVDQPDGSRSLTTVAASQPADRSLELGFDLDRQRYRRAGVADPGGSVTASSPINNWHTRVASGVSTGSCSSCGLGHPQPGRVCDVHGNPCTPLS